MQTASGYFPESISSSTNHSFVNSTENNHQHHQHNNHHQQQQNNHSNNSTAFDFSTGGSGGGGVNSAIGQSSANNFSSSNPFVNHDNAHNVMRQNSGAFTTNLDDDAQQQLKQQSYGKDHHHLRHNKNIKWPDAPTTSESPHEYHEISDDEMTTDKVFDLGPSLLDEMDFMFRSMSTGTSGGGGGGTAASFDSTISGGGGGEPKSPDFENTNKKNEITELAAKLHRKNSASAGIGGSATLGKSLFIT